MRNKKVNTKEEVSKKSTTAVEKAPEVKKIRTRGTGKSTKSTAAKTEKAPAKKQKTEQLLLTAPVSLFGVVFGKFLAAYTVFAASTVFTSLYFLLLSVYGNVQAAMLFGNIIAILLVGMAFIAIGTFVSAITESQLSAAVLTIGILAAFMVMTFLCDLLPETAWLRYVIETLSIFYRFQNFTNGIFDFVALFYYLSISALFLFLTVRVFDRRRFR